MIWEDGSLDIAANYPWASGKNAVQAVRVIGNFFVGVDKTDVKGQIAKHGIDHLRWQLSSGEIDQPCYRFTVHPFRYVDGPCIAWNNVKGIPYFFLAQAAATPVFVGENLQGQGKEDTLFLLHHIVNGFYKIHQGFPCREAIIAGQEFLGSFELATNIIMHCPHHFSRNG